MAKNQPGQEPRRQDSRRGIALLMILGVLSVLLITAVAFAIFMRLERAGAANYRHGTTARHMLQAGLARAIEDIHENTGLAPYPRFNRLQDDSIPFHDHVLPSVDPEQVPARVLSTETMLHVPHVLRQAMHKARPHWVPVTSQNRLVGRYAYIVANVSGLLDANYAGGDRDEEGNPISRGVGGDPREIRLSRDLLPEMGDDPMQFARERRERHGRYENLPELRKLNQFLDGNRLAHFSVYSRDPVPHNFAERAYIGEDFNLWNEARIRQALQRSGVPNFTTPGGLRQHDVALRAMRDFVSEGQAPEDFNYPSIKPVPKICTFGVTASYTRKTIPETNPQQYRHTIRYGFIAGAAAPYRTPPEGSYSINFRFRMTDYWRIVADGSEGLTPHLDFSVESLGPSVPAPPANQQLYHHTDMQDDSLRYEVVNTDPYPEMHFILRAAAEVHHDSDGPVDKAPATGLAANLSAPDWAANEGIPIVIEINQERIEEAEPEGPDQANLWFWSETFDPRFNWLPSLWIQSTLLDIAAEATGRNRPRPEDALMHFPTWLAAQAFSAGSYAERQALFDAIPNRQPLDTAEFMDAAPGKEFFQAGARMATAPNRPFETVGELGYMLIGPWSTIRLDGFRTGQNPRWNMPAFTDHRPPHRVLDNFTLLEEAKAVAGRVNINTRVDNVLASVFLDMPLRETVEDQARLPMDIENARRLDQVLQEWREPPDEEPRYIARLSDLGEIFDGAIGEALNDLIKQRINPAEAEPIHKISTFDREAIIRNSSGLFSFRDQLYLVIMRADAFAPRFGFTDIEQGTVLATGHAVALVWRDSLPDPGDESETPVHPTLIRMFNMLEH